MNFFMASRILFRLPCYHMNDVILCHFLALQFTDRFTVTHDYEPGTGTEHFFYF
jgi:hypothetical protein